MQPTINLHIDKITLHGFKNIQRHQLQHYLQKEIHRLIRDQGLHDSMHHSGDIKKINTSPIKLSSPAKEKQLGNQIAGKIYRGLRR